MRNVRACGVVVLVLASLGTGCTAIKRFLYEGFGRDEWQRPAEVLQVLDLQPGARVADLGAGGGYFTFRLADAVGPSGTVYAVDVDPGMIAYLEDRAAADGYENVRAILAAPDDPRLPAAELDWIVTCNTYHHLDNRPRYFARVARALRAGGRVAIIEHRGDGLLRGLGHATPPALIRQEMEAAGYRLRQDLDLLSRQSFLVFEIASEADGAGTAPAPTSRP